MAYEVTFSRNGSTYRTQTVQDEFCPEGAAFMALPVTWQAGDRVRVEEGPGYVDFVVKDDEGFPVFEEA